MVILGGWAFSYERGTPVRLFLMSHVPLYARSGQAPRVRHREGGQVSINLFIYLSFYLSIYLSIFVYV